MTITCSRATVGYIGQVYGVLYVKRTDQQIKANESLASSVCTSRITDMTELFSGKTSFNGDISLRS